MSLDTKITGLYATIRFDKGCFGFKLSPTYNNRMYFYQDDYNMNMRIIPSGKWFIESQEEIGKEVVVKLRNLLT